MRVRVNHRNVEILVAEARRVKGLIGHRVAFVMITRLMVMMMTMMMLMLLLLLLLLMMMLRHVQ